MDKYTKKLLKRRDLQEKKLIKRKGIEEKSEKVLKNTFKQHIDQITNNIKETTESNQDHILSGFKYKPKPEENISKISQIINTWYIIGLKYIGLFLLIFITYSLFLLMQKVEVVEGPKEQSNSMFIDSLEGSLNIIPKIIIIVFVVTIFSLLIGAIGFGKIGDISIGDNDELEDDEEDKNDEEY